MTTVDTHLMLRALCDELARCGLQHAATSPGSRNTPILMALHREPRIRCWSHIDERSGAFFALGAAKASGRPVALTCTSGTAAANYLPAVVEAGHARVPLIVLTADRPAELREVGAGQAIDQVKLYGDAVRWYSELDVERASADRLRWIRQLACRAYWTALGAVPGPVHLNVPLREPLVLEDRLPEDPVPGRAGGRPWVSRPRAAGRYLAGSPPTAGRRVPAHGIVVAGRDERGGRAARAAVAFAQRAAYPLLADPLSPARAAPQAIATYDLLLRDPGFAAAIAPELVIRVGDLPTSKPLRTWLASLDGTPQWALDPERAWQDPAGVLSEHDAGDAESLLESLALGGPPDPGWLRAWADADAAAGTAIDDSLGEELSEPAVARLLGASLAPEDILFVASSMPIRDAELFLPAGRPLPRILSNRGANGIDGTVSTALGVAAASARRVVLLIGDVALVHDIGGLMATRRPELALTIVLLNNDGGGIFHFLPISSQRDAFEELVATPHGLRFADAARLYGLDYAHAATVDDLRAALPGDEAGSRLIEVRTDRVENLALHRRVADGAVEAVRRLSRPAPAASPPA